MAGDYRRLSGFPNRIARFEFQADQGCKGLPTVTPLRRPNPSASGVKPERIMPAADVARAFLDVYRLTRNTVVEEIVLRPQLGDL